jgi:hypothetical protein
MRSRFDDFDRYMDEVRNMLEPNATDDYKEQYITYGYTTDEVDTYIPYFKECMSFGLSPYKALLFFSDHLIDNNDEQE